MFAKWSHFGLILCLLVVSHRGSRATAQAVQSPTAAPAMPTSAPGLVYTSEDGQYQLRANFWLQALARFGLDDAAGQQTDTFSLRRVRPRFEGTLFGRLDFLFMLETGGEGRVALLDAYADLRIVPELHLRFGKQKQPFSLDRLQGFPMLPMVERTFGSMIGPNRDLGIVAWGELFGGALVYQVGLFNGVPDGQNAQEDLDDGKDVVGRVLFRPLHASETSPLRKLAIGAAASYGRAHGVDGESGSAALQTPTYTTPGRARMFAYNSASESESGRVAAVFADGERRRLEVDGYWYWDRLSFFGELVQTRNSYRAPGVTDTISSTVTAWDLMIAFVLTNDSSSYERGVEAHAPIDPAHGHWGAVEVAARVQGFHVDAAAFPQLANLASSVSYALNTGVSLNWTLNRHLRLQLDLERTTFRHGASTGDRPTETLAIVQMTLRT